MRPSPQNWRDWPDDAKLKLLERLRATPARSARADEVAGECRESFAAFVRNAWPVVEPAEPLVWGWYLDAICDHLQAVAEGRILRLIINIPPGMAKSLIAAVLWPAWRWTRDPGWRLLAGSYAIDLAMRDNVRARDLLTSDWFVSTFTPDWGFESDQNVKGYYRNTAKGERLAVSTGSKATGFRGHCVMVDDPHNVMDVETQPGSLELVRFWFDKVLETRVIDARTAERVVIMQRVHDEDATAHLLREGDWEHLVLPMEFEPERRCRTSLGWADPRTAKGELLFPERFDSDVVAKLKRKLGGGPSGASAQLQQNPVPATGNIFNPDWWRRYDVLPQRFDEIVVSVDCSFKAAAGSDMVAIAVWGRLAGTVYLIEVVCDRMGFSDTCAAVATVARRYGPMTTVLVEDAANGPAVIDVLRGLVPGLIEVKPLGGKPARANAVEPIVMAGSCWIPRDGAQPWLAEWLLEHTKFPMATHDDQVDTTSQALLWLYRKGSPGAHYSAGDVRAGMVRFGATNR